MAKKKLTKAERDERDARHERVLANARRTRELAERAQAKLEAQRGPRVGNESMALPSPQVITTSRGPA
jgi:hypothetical protein